MVRSAGFQLTHSRLLVALLDRGPHHLNLPILIFLPFHRCPPYCGRAAPIAPQEGAGLRPHFLSLPISLSPAAAALLRATFIIFSFSAGFQNAGRGPRLAGLGIYLHAGILTRHSLAARCPANLRVSRSCTS